MQRRARSIRMVGAVLMVLFSLMAAPAAAQQPPGPDGQGTDYFVTIAARECPTYEDITANRARNNIQESLRDLGPNTPYTDGQVVDADVEQAVQPNCTPLPNWTFTLGNAIAPGKVTGHWGSLSVVSGVDGSATTIASVPRRDDLGRPEPVRTIAGATTIELTQAQLNRAPGGNLWIQGGTPTDPVLNARFPDEFGFGSIRCATDNYNGDNVEYIRFPTGRRHVYCFAYYVTPPPDSARIVIRKQVTDPPNADQRFTFEGNISFTPDQRFDLNVANGSTPSQTFYRAETKVGDEPWDVRELVPSGWDLTGLACTRTSSGVIVNQAEASVSISLVAGDTVTCTFTDALRPPPGNLLLSKITFGGLGTFGFTVRRNGSEDPVARTHATTTSERVPADAASGPIDLDAGTYTVTERLPRSRDGRWHPVSVNCSARSRTGRRPSAQVSITAGEGRACVFTNRFVPFGRIEISKVTRGRTGTTGFQIVSAADPAREFIKSATTTAENRPALARGDSTRHLRLGRYIIRETGTTSEGEGRWTLVSVRCGGRFRAFTQGQTTVRLTRDRPHVRCRFVNVFTPDASPLPPPEPTPQPSPPTPTPQPDLVVTKRALERRVLFGRIATFEVVVRNAGDGPAEQVIVGDGIGANAQLVSARTSRGSCNDRAPVVCRIGLLDAGERATIRVRVRAVGTPRIRNIAVAGSASRETTLANNADRALVHVRSQGGVLGLICAWHPMPVAHAAC